MSSWFVTVIVEEEPFEDVTNNGDVTDEAIDAWYPGSLFKLPRFVANGLQNILHPDYNIYPDQNFMNPLVLEKKSFW